jgi:hypothetical protein
VDEALETSPEGSVERMVVRAAVLVNRDGGLSA